MKNLKKVLTRLELQKEKQKDYRNIVIIQVVMIVFGLTLSAPLLESSTSSISKFIITLFSAFAALYVFLLWDLLRNFTTNKILILTFLILLSGITVVGFLGEFPYYKILEIQNRQAYLLILHGLLFPIEVTVIGFAIRDIFSGGFLTPDKLWGAACVFLLTGLTFASLYDLICIISPGSLGENIEWGIPNYAECVAYSLSILGGMDTPYPNAVKLVRNIGVIESVWSNLFVVLIIGKLLGLPRAPEAES